MAGADSMNSSVDALLERVVGREFILNVNKSASLDIDPYFNNYDPNRKSVSWKTSILQRLNWKNIKEKQDISTNEDHKAIIENNIIQNYRKNVKFVETEGGAIEIAVTHIDPQKGAEYANKFMEKIRQLVENENKTAQDRKLNYLSETLADALQDMEITQKNLTSYALENSAKAKEKFMTGSLQLDDMRMEKRKAEEFDKILSILKSLVESGNLDTSKV